MGRVSLSKIIFPQIVERGPTGLKGRATIHRTPTTVGSKTYESFMVVYYLNGERKRERFNEYSKAFSQAEEVATKLSNGESAALELTGDDRRIYVGAMASLRDCEDVSLEMAVREYVQARKLLGPVPIMEAVKFYDRHGRTVVKSGTLQDILDAMLAALEADKRGEYHRRDLKRMVGKFIAHFNCPITEIANASVNEWLRGLDVAGRTRDNYRDAVHNFFGFAQAEGYLPKELPHALRDAKRVNEAGADNEVFTPEEAEKLLRGAPERLIPSLALKLFSGIRTEEMLLIRWESIKFDQDVIFLTKDITKTKKRRLSPLLPNLKQWLLPYVGQTGIIADRWSSAQSLSHSWTRRAEKVGVRYKKNAMRNSYASYRLAIAKDIAQVALESGNSPGVLQENYLELVTEQDAQKWFSIAPN
ncbi:hypothetical protein BH09VER1_BH09VER1_17980 [soil metagenome]